MIVCEVGLNHMGDLDYANNYVNKIIQAKPDAITFQIREESFYSNEKFHALILPDDFYMEASKRVINNSIKVGLAIADINKIDFFEKLNIDFYKILSKDIGNYSLLKKVFETNKRVFISTGMSDFNEITTTLNFFKNYKNKITLIHTQLSHSLRDVNLYAITSLRKKFDVNVAFGFHSYNKNVLFMALVYLPSDLFLYIKGDKVNKHPDEKHAIELNQLPDLINELRILPNAIGTGEKIRMNDLIESDFK